MELIQSKTVKAIATLLLLLAVTQPIYTALFLAAPDFDRLFIWRLEAVAFVLLIALCLSAAIAAKRHALGFTSIAIAALLKLLAVGVGLTQFWPFSGAAELDADLGGVATSVVALSFFFYNCGNILLGLAAVQFGKTAMRNGRRLLGRASLAVGIIAFIGNALVMAFGFEGIVPSPIGGASGVLASALLALCMLKMSRETATDADAHHE